MNDERPAKRTTASVAPAPSGPPRLRTGLLRRLKLLLLMNILPIAAIILIINGLANGSMRLRGNFTQKEGVALIVMAAGAIAILLSSWVLLPIGCWLRDYPAWHYRHTSASTWLLPRILGWCAWAAIWLLVAAAAIGGLYLMISGGLQFYRGFAPRP